MDWNDIKKSYRPIGVWDCDYDDTITAMPTIPLKERLQQHQNNIQYAIETLKGSGII